MAEPDGTRTGPAAAVGKLPVLTVVLPHFGCARYLGASVASVLGQHLRDLALIVVDDASPSGAWIDALRPFAGDPRMTVLVASRNVGHYRIKNAALRLLRSPYVGFQDADDISHPERFGRQVRRLRRGRADIVGCGFERIDETGAVLSRRRMVRNGNLWMRLGKSFVTLHSTTVVRREVLERLGGFDGTARVAADSDFHLRAAHLYRIQNIRPVLYQYRLWPGSLTSSLETGFGSDVRRAYAEAMWQRERHRRLARSKEDLLPLLVAPPNDVDFDLHPIPPGRLFVAPWAPPAAPGTARGQEGHRP